MKTYRRFGRVGVAAGAALLLLSACGDEPNTEQVDGRSAYEAWLASDDEVAAFERERIRLFRLVEEVVPLADRVIDELRASTTTTSPEGR